MRVLFVSRAKGSGISPIVENQGRSLQKNGVDVSYYKVERSGIFGYLVELKALRSYLRQHDFDVIHAHYSLIAVITSLAAFPRKIVTSLMGSDTKTNAHQAIIVRFFCNYLWVHTIVKSKQMSHGLNLDKISIIPNGVDYDVFIPLDKLEAQRKLGFDVHKRHVVFFLSHSTRKEKNVDLAELAMSGFDPNEVVFHIVSYVEPTLVPSYLCAADLLLLTSFHEGSPNIVKEAMACCIPIVSTNVGDVQELITSTEGCYICTYNVDDVRAKIRKALDFNARTNGRSQISSLDSNIIAKRIIALYQEVV